MESSAHRDLLPPIKSVSYMVLESNRTPAAIHYSIPFPSSLSSSPNSLSPQFTAMISEGQRNKSSQGSHHSFEGSVVKNKSGLSFLNIYISGKMGY